MLIVALLLSFWIQGAEAQNNTVVTGGGQTGARQQNTLDTYVLSLNAVSESQLRELEDKIARLRELQQRAQALQTTRVEVRCCR